MSSQNRFQITSEKEKMSKVKKNEIYVRVNVYKEPPERNDAPFGSSVIGTGLTLTTKFVNNFGKLECILKNDRNEKLAFNYKLELFASMEWDGRVKMVAKSIEGLELEGNESCDLGFDTFKFQYHLNCNFLLDTIFRFEFEDIRTHKEKPLTIPRNNEASKFCLFEDEDFKDFKLKIGENILMTHRLVLATESKVFRALLQHGTPEQRNEMIEVEGGDVDLFKAFLKYLYTKEIDDMKNTALELLMLGEKYGVEGLKRKCEVYLCEVTNDSNALTYLIHAHMTNSNLLKEFAFKNLPSIKDIFRKREGRDLFRNYPSLFKDTVLSLDSDKSKE